MNVTRGPARRAGAAWALLLLICGGAVVALAADTDGAAAQTALVGYTVDSRGQVVSGVEVRVSGISSGSARALLASARSDARGRFAISGLAPGAYRVIAVKGGYSVLVGQIDTLLQDTLELVLRPAGTPGGPGTVPEDGSWALRLPQRDRLESRGAIALAENLTPGEDPTRGLPPLSAELLATRSQGSVDETSSMEGISGRFGGTFDLVGRGLLGVDFQHRGEGQGGALHESGDAVRLRYAPPEDGGAMPVAVQMNLMHHRRDGQPLSGSEQLLDTRTSGGRVQASWTSVENGLGVQLDVTRFEGDERPLGVANSARSELTEPVEPTEFDAQRAAVHVVKTIERDSARETQLGLTLRETSGARFDGPGDLPSGRVSRIIMPMADAEADAFLEALEGQQAEFRLRERWRLDGGRTELIGNLRAAAYEGEVSHPAPAVGTLSIGARWVLARSLALSAEGGWVGDGADLSEPLYHVGVSGSSSRWQWSMSNVREVAFSPFALSVSVTPMRAFGLPLVAGQGAIVDRWSVGAGLSGGGWVPAVFIRGGRFEIAGDLAARFRDDLAVVPVAEAGQASGTVVDLTVDQRRTGTLVEFGWVELVDEQPDGALLDGASALRRQRVHVRQRLGDRASYGATWHLLFAMERSDVRSTRPQAERTARLALLDERRVSGGLAVAF
ncbi:MAG: carboxypeptidase regulatory-like domain-containing protein [Acidobacteriota bacterium]|nr:MAG: carboxypeptidase regulatory-like domain-containing protein [Acidobacteriota bacterium]